MSVEMEVVKLLPKNRNDYNIDIFSKLAVLPYLYVTLLFCNATTEMLELN